MNWLMGSHPLVLGAWIVAFIGTALLVIGRHGKLVSHAEFCRRCGHETMSGGSRCTECGARLGVSSLRLAFELNHPLLARLGAVTRRGRRVPHTPLVAWGALALLIGVGIGAGVPALRLARIDWNRFRDSESLLVHAQALNFDDPRSARILGVLASRESAGRLTPPQAAAYQRLVVARDQYALARAVEQYEVAARQPIYAAAVPGALPTQRSAALPPQPAVDADIDFGTAALIDVIRAQIAEATDSRKVLPYQPPPLVSGYAPLASSDAGPLGGPSRSSLPLNLILGDVLPDARAFTTAANHAPRISPATGLAPRGSLTAGAALPVTTGLPAAPIPALGGSAFPTHTVRPSTLGNPALTPGTLTNRPLAPARISNTFGR